MAVDYGKLTPKQRRAVKELSDKRARRAKKSKDKAESYRARESSRREERSDKRTGKYLTDLTVQYARSPHRGSLPGHMLADPKTQEKFRAAGVVPRLPEGGVITKTIENLADAAIYTPAGIAEAGKAVGKDTYATRKGDFSFKRSRKLGKEVVKATASDLRHPLRNPGYTGLTALAALTGGASAGARGAAALGQLKRGSIRRAATAKPHQGGSLLHKPLPKERTQKLGRLEVRDRYALNPALAAGQKVYDKVRERTGADPTKRVARLVAEERRITDAVARAPADALSRAGVKLTEPQRMALRVYNEGVPVEQVIARHKEFLGEAVGQKRRDLQHKLGLLEASRKYLDDVDGSPALKQSFKTPRRRKTGRKGVTAPALKAIADRIDRVGGDHPGGREALLKELGLLDDTQAASRKNAPGRIMLGAEYAREGQRGVRGQRYIDLEGKQLPARTTSRKRELTPEEASRKIDQLEQWVGKRVDVVTKAMLSDPALRQRSSGKDTRARRIQSDADRFKTQAIGQGDAVDPSGMKPVRQQEGRAATRAKAEAEIARLGRKEGAHPMLKQIAERMDELDRLKAAMLQRSEQAAGIADEGTTPLPLGEVDEITSVRVPARYGTEIGRKDQGRLVGAEDFTGGRTRIPDTPLVQRPAANRPAVFRGGVPKKPGSLTHGYSGALRRSGNYRTDTERLVAESAVEAQRYGSVERLRQRVIKAGENERPEGDFVPVRMKNLTPKEGKRLRAILERVERGADNLTPEEHQAAAQAVKAFTENAFPALGDFAHVPAGGKVNGVTWVPRKLVDGVNRDAQRALLGPAGRYFDTAQNVVKGSILFAKPTAYVAANAAGNALFNLAQQGVLAPANWKHAARISKDPDLAAWVDGAAGGGFVRSIVEGTNVRGGGAGQISAGLENVGNLLGKLSDSVFRRAAFMHEARRYGFKSDAELRELFTNPEHHELLTEISGRARSAIVDYERLGPFERDVVRRALFVYPWVKGATLYAGHFLGEHPIQAATYAQLSRKGQEQAFKDLSDVPSYARGLFKVGGSRETPLTVNPSNLNPFGTPAQLGRAAAYALTGKGGSADKPFELLSPFISGAVEASQGRSSFTGAPVEGGLPGLLKSLVDTSAPGALVDQLHKARGDQSERTYPTTPGQAAGRFALGTAFPRNTNRQALNEQAARESEGKLSPVERANRRVFNDRQKLFEEAKRVAPEMVRGGKLSERVRRSYSLEADRQQRYAQASQGRKSGTRSYHLGRYMADVSFLAHNGQIDKSKIAPFRTWAESATLEELKSARRGISERYYQREGGQLYWISAARKYVKSKGGSP